MWSSAVQDVAELATAAGAVFVAFQVRIARQDMRAQFEQRFVLRYDTIMEKIAFDVLLGEHTTLDPQSQRAMYDYFELCEEELFYRARLKVSGATWQEWWTGIEFNLRRPAFRAAWDDLKDRPVVQPADLTAARPTQFQMLRRAVRAMDQHEAFDSAPRRLRR